MITEEIEHKLGRHESTETVKDELRALLARQTEEYLRKGGRIESVAPEVSAEAKRFFNNQGPINPAKYRKTEWARGGVDKRFGSSNFPKAEIE